MELSKSSGRKSPTAGPGTVSAPTTAICKTSNEIQDIINKSKRSNSFVETKYKFTISSDRLSQLRKTVDVAMRDHKVFTIKGGWPVIRRELLRRGWIEKFENNTFRKNYDELTSNLPAKQDWESQSAYTEKCERTVMSRMLANYDVDFYWSMKKESGDLKHRANAFKLINRFSRSLFSSKEGLALLLQQSYWYSEPGVALCNFPRCYVLGFPDHYNLFIDDFRMTACMGLLKWFVETYETKSRNELTSPDGQIPYSTIIFALNRCEDYISCQKHQDIDKEIGHLPKSEWDNFLNDYYTIVHQRGIFQELKDVLSIYANIKTTLKEIHRYWPEYDIDGKKNIWILKPGNKCRGRGITLIKNTVDVDKIMSLKLKYVVQKYIEKPLIIYETKFDIRQWFMVTSVQPLTVWIYKESYLRFSSQIFSLSNFHESLHLTNHAVQCKYSNVQQRDKRLPDDNMWDCHTFQNYLTQIGCGEKWNDVIFPGMKQSIILAMLASQDTMDRRPNTFEIYGADFMLSEDFRPWLLEINCSPDMSFSTKVTSRMCPQCMEDIIKVMIDKRKDPKADTGGFELIYKQNIPRIPPYLGINLAVRGRKIFRYRTKSKVDTKDSTNLISQAAIKRHELIKNEIIKDTSISKIVPKILSAGLYKGPVIQDLIEELHKSYSVDDSGVDFVPVKKKGSEKKKQDRDKVVKSCKPLKKSKSSFANSKRLVVSGKESRKVSAATVTGKWAINSSKITRKEKNGEAGDWEKQTASILKSKQLVMDVNKNYLTFLPQFRTTA